MSEIKVGALVDINVTSPSKRHFETGMRAVVGLSYEQQYGDEDEAGCEDDEWTIMTKDGAVSWYDASEMTVVTPSDDRRELLARRAMTARGERYATLMRELGL